MGDESLPVPEHGVFLAASVSYESFECRKGYGAVHAYAVSVDVGFEGDVAPASGQGDLVPRKHKEVRCELGGAAPYDLPRRFWVFLFLL